MPVLFNKSSVVSSCSKPSFWQAALIDTRMAAALETLNTSQIKSNLSRSFSDSLISIRFNLLANCYIIFQLADGGGILHYAIGISPFIR